METKDILKKLREDNNLTQDQMADKLMVTRQAVSRWELGETQPNTETLKLLSKEFNISINTLLGSPNEEYCTWCYTDGSYAYKSKEALIDFLISHMPNPENLSEGDRRAQYDGYLSQLEYWK